MGAWGPKLYDDDLALDVRDAFLYAVQHGEDPSSTSDRLMLAFSTDIAEPQAMPAFWLALADTQVTLGLLEPRIRDAALRVIVAGGDVHEWTQPEDRLARSVELADLRGRLISSGLVTTSTEEIRRISINLDVGDVGAFVLKSGKLALFEVVGRRNVLGGPCPVICWLDWAEDHLPPDVNVLQYRKDLAGRSHTPWLIGGAEDDDAALRIIAVGASRCVANETSGRCVVVPVGEIDARLAQAWGLT